MLAFPPFRLDPEEGRLWKGKKLLALRRKPFAILAYLASRPRKLVTHEELLAQVWRGAVVSDSAMRSHLHELRQVLGDGVIETVIGRGSVIGGNVWLMESVPPGSKVIVEPARHLVRQRGEPRQLEWDI